jgi:dethiobiotin synthetase
MRRLVLLGTGTGVGKTYVGTQLVAGWRERGHPAWGLKPIESGVAGGGANVSDAERLRGSGRLNPEGLHFRALAEALSPHLAARLEQTELSLGATVDWVQRSEARLSAMHDNTPLAMSLIETAGGAWTPLAPGATCADLALALEPARIVLVAPDALGVLHDVSATLLSLAAVGCRVDLVVLSGARPVDASTGTNAAELERIVFPRLGRAAPTSQRVFSLPADSDDVGSLLDAWALLE